MKGRGYRCLIWGTGFLWRNSWIWDLLDPLIFPHVFFFPHKRKSKRTLWLWGKPGQAARCRTDHLGLWITDIRTCSMFSGALAVCEAPGGFMSFIEPAVAHFVTHALMMMWHSTLWILKFLKKLCCITITDLHSINQVTGCCTLQQSILNWRLLANYLPKLFLKAVILHPLSLCMYSYYLQTNSWSFF